MTRGAIHSLRYMDPQSSWGWRCWTVGDDDVGQLGVTRLADGRWWRGGCWGWRSEGLSYSATTEYVRYTEVTVCFKNLVIPDSDRVSRWAQRIFLAFMTRGVAQSPRAMDPQSSWGWRCWTVGDGKVGQLGMTMLDSWGWQGWTVGGDGWAVWGWRSWRIGRWCKAIGAMRLDGLGWRAGRWSSLDLR